MTHAHISLLETLLRHSPDHNNQINEARYRAAYRIQQFGRIVYGQNSALV